MPESLFPLATYCLVMTATPGPNNVMLATSGANFGYWRTLPHLMGVALGVCFLTIGVCLGLGSLFLQVDGLQGALKFLGSACLVYLAWKLAGASAAVPGHHSRPLSFVEGAAFQLVNPKSWIRAITIAAVFMPADMPPMSGALLVSGIGLAIALPVISAWALFGVAIGRFLHAPRRLRAFNVAMASSLVVLAIAAVWPA